ncbi:hypothetical protein [Microlunatus soli]|uniref:hypothetical protein n=1 Tax=Microlunatus soli TaxID=630515 RepID=UPI000B84DDC7|nr:hypothetical protein [Microlunatus soli]
MGGSAPRDGQVTVHLSNGKTETIAGKPGFGSSLTFVCNQLVIGSPYESAAGIAEAGAVHVYGPTDSGTIERRATYTAGRNGVPGTPQQGAHFGTAVASTPDVRPGSDPGSQRLYIGIPGEDVNGIDGAGRVTSFTTGTGDGPVGAARTTTYATPGVAGVPSPNAGLGTTISVDAGIVAIGAPGQPVGGVARAGKVMIESINNDFTTYSLSQDSRNFPGTAETGDRFGWSVHVAPSVDSSPTRLLIGVPDETIDGIVHAGAVDVVPFSEATGRPNDKIVAWDQDSPGMAGATEQGDRFGWAVGSAVIGDLQQLVVGTPYEAIGDREAAGMVQTIRTGLAWTQSTRGVPGTPESGDRMGASLSGSIMGLAIGLPGENDASGAVIVGVPQDEETPELLLPQSSGSPACFGSALQH